MPVGRLGAIEEYPVALVRGARLQPSEPASLRASGRAAGTVSREAAVSRSGIFDLSRRSTGPARSLIRSVPRLRMLDEHHFRSLGKPVVGNLDRIAHVDNVGN
jgi:hypothetical protein